MTNTENRSTEPLLRNGPLITGAALFGAGGLLGLAGLAVGGSHLVSATRRRVEEMEVPPSELAKLKWLQAKAAVAAGASAWKDGSATHPATSS
jgi:hypothetical protein